MKRLLSLALSLALAFGPAIAYASPGTIIKGDVLDGFENLLVNPSFDRATVAAGWSFGTGASGAASSSPVIDGKQALAVTLVSSTGTLVYQDVLPGGGSLQGVNLEASMWVNAAAGTSLQVCARSGGTTLTSTCVTVPATATWQKVSANMVGPASGTVGVALYSTGTVTAGFTVDGAYVGRARNLSQVSQAQWVGSLNFNCTSYWSYGASTTWGVFGNNGGTCTVTPSGAITNNGTTTQAILNNAGPGTYKVVYTSDFRKATGNAGVVGFRISDGTNTGAAFSVGAGAQEVSGGGSLEGRFTYTTAQTSITWQLQGVTDGNSNVARVGQGNTQATSGTGSLAGINSPSIMMQADVYYYPSQSQLAVRADQTPASWSGTSTLSGTTASTTITDLGSVTGSMTTTTSRNMTCSAAASLVGITCNLPRLGNYQVCFGGSAGNTASANFVQVQLTDGSNTAITGTQTSSVPAANGYEPIGTCGNYLATSSTPTFKVRGLAGAGTESMVLSTMSVTELDAPMPAPYLVGSVTSNTQGQERVERLSFGGAATGGVPTSVCSASTCVIATQSGSWVSSITRASLGNYTLNIAAGEFSAPPVCTASVITNGGSAFAFPIVASSSTSAVNVLVEYANSGTSTAPQDGEVNVICQGPR